MAIKKKNKKIGIKILQLHAQFEGWMLMRSGISLLKTKNSSVYSEFYTSDPLHGRAFT